MYNSSIISWKKKNEIVVLIILNDSNGKFSQNVGKNLTRYVFQMKTYLSSRKTKLNLSYFDLIRLDLKKNLFQKRMFSIGTISNLTVQEFMILWFIDSMAYLSFYVTKPVKIIFFFGFFVFFVYIVRIIHNLYMFLDFQIFAALKYANLEWFYIVRQILSVSR